MALMLIIALPFLGMVLPLMAERFGRVACSWATAVMPMLSLGLLLNFSEIPFSGEKLVVSHDWLPELGLNLSLRLDGLSFLFGLLILGIGLLVILYARYYLSKSEPTGRFFSYFLFFMGSMLGLVFSENLLLMLMFWELTSLSSFLLISFWNHRADARQGARMALAITGGGGLALLAGILLIGQIVGSYDLSVVLASGDLLRASDLYPVMLILVLLGAFAKSAQFPFHFWLPQAMAAPTPVSAYLHSATMVKAGVFLLARLYPALSGTDWWFYIVSLTGLTTLLVGAVMALFQHDLKGLLAYSTVSHLGLITLLFGLDTTLGAVAGTFHIINHATFKASLFMAAGIIDHETGTRDMRRLNGLWRFLPHTGALAMVASFAMAGVPLLNGFLSKEMFFTETLQQRLMGSFYWITPAVAIIASAFAVAYSVRFIHDVFFNGEPLELPKFPPHEPPRYMKIPVEILVLVCLAVGIFPSMTVGPLLYAAVYAELGGEVPFYNLALWHGLNAPLLMSLVAMVGGVCLYAMRKPLFRWYDGLPSINSLEVFEQVLTRVMETAQRIQNAVDNNSLQRYMIWMLLLAVGMTFFALMPLPELSGPVALSPIDPMTTLGLFVMCLLAILTVLLHHRRLVAVLIMSGVGLFVALIFARYSAPDLSLTQLSVEVVSAILLVLTLFFMPDYTPVEDSSVRILRDLLLATAVGSIIAMLTYAVLTRPYDSMAHYFLDNSLAGGGGTNVVNVILVDFRGFDTLGEITVLAIAAIGVFALLQGLRLPHPTHDYRGRTWSKDSHPMILDNLSRCLLPLALMISVYIFLRGHNMPGGGFIAGLVTAVALLLQYISHGVRWTPARQPIRYHTLAGLGVLIAALTGMSSWFFDAPFLTSAFGHFELPWLGDLELASAMAFDLGVYMAVVGATLLMMSNIGYVSQDEDVMGVE